MGNRSFIHCVGQLSDYDKAIDVTARVEKRIVNGFALLSGEDNIQYCI